MPPKKQSPTESQNDLSALTDPTSGEQPLPPAVEGSTEERVSEAPVETVDRVAHEILTGVWGSYNGLRDRLENAGYDVSAVIAKVNDRLSRGAPTAHRPSAFELAEQVLNGEWGPERGLKERLAAAGFSAVNVAAVLKKSGK